MVGQNLLEITEAQFYFLAVEWMETYRSKPVDREGALRERFQSMATSELIKLYGSAGPELVKNAVREELGQRNIHLSE